MAALTYDADNPTTIDPNSEVTITITGGYPLFTWTVTGTGFSFRNSVTCARTNTLIAGATACGTAVITVTETPTFLSKIRSLLDEPASKVFTDEQLENWWIEATIDISTKTLCYEQTDTITTESGTLEYDAPSGCIFVHSCIYNNQGLTCIHPRLLNHIAVDNDPGSPLFYYHHHGKIAIYPVADGVYTVRVLFSKVTEDICNLPDMLRNLTILYAVAMARLSEGWEDDFEMFIIMYLNSLMAYKRDICRYSQVYVDARDKFRMPEGKIRNA